jgi:membrane fusion protein (multidrug efflux system)
VYVVDPNGVLRSKKIEVVAEMPDLYVVNDLSTNDKILLDGLRLVKENQKIDYTYIDPNKVMHNLNLHAE